MKRHLSKLNTRKNARPEASKLLERGASKVYPQANPMGMTLKEEANGTTDGKHAFDLDERTAVFGEAIVKFCKSILRDPTNNRLIDQLVGCGTSVGANHREATESLSKKDFRCSIGRCVKEAKETKFFLRMIAASESTLVKHARDLYRESNELHMIFATIFRKSSK